MKHTVIKRVLLGLTGSIAAYKSAELCRLLRREGIEVRVVMTQSATAFITPLSLQALSGNPVHTDLLNPAEEAAMGHINLAKWADAIVIAPASANFIARLANGFADDLLSSICLATEAPIYLAPAMNQAMWRNVAVKDNLARCLSRGVRCLGPDAGQQACGDVGPGRMLEPEAILAALTSHQAQGLLANKHVVITAGPTQEPIDPVRFLSNRSSGKMGYALAAAAKRQGARVTLISGPVSLPAPDNIDVIQVTTALQMLEACQKACRLADVFIANAAVSDQRPCSHAEQKLKKPHLLSQLELMDNPDILATIAQSNPRPFCVGFAAETEQLLEHAQAKLQRKGADLIIANQVNDRGLGFGSDELAVTLVAAERHWSLPSTTKIQLAEQLIAIIADRLTDKLTRNSHAQSLASEDSQ